MYDIVIFAFKGLLIFDILRVWKKIMNAVLQGDTNEVLLDISGTDIISVWNGSNKTEYLYIYYESYPNLTTSYQTFF